jgi:4-carboxymuconolactone decarboxylase
MKMQTRIALPDPDEMSPQGKDVVQSILQTRGNLDGPFLAWLYSPEFASRAEKLGAFCRYSTRLSMAESELLILVVSAHLKCNGEWQIHEQPAHDAGLDIEAIRQIQMRKAPDFPEGRLAILYSFAFELLTTNRISEPTFAKATAIFMLPELVEIVGIVGYYSLVALTLNAFAMRLAESPAPFQP